MGLIPDVLVFTAVAVTGLVAIRLGLAAARGVLAVAAFLADLQDDDVRLELARATGVFTEVTP